MNRIQIAQWLDIAIDYLPTAQKFRDEMEAHPPEDPESKGYMRGLRDISNKVIARHHATAVELVAANLLQALTTWELYDPSLLISRRIESDADDMPNAMIPGIINSVKTLANVTGRDIPLNDPLVHFVDPVIPDTEPVELSLADALRINEAADLMGCTIESLLRQAENHERLLYVAIKPHAAKLSAIPSHPKPLTVSYTTRDIKIIAMQPQYAKSLVVTGSADIRQYEAGFEPPLADHYFRLDTPQTVGIDMVYFPRSQLLADALATTDTNTKPDPETLLKPPNAAKLDDTKQSEPVNTPAPENKFSIFLSMNNLTSDELTLTFVGNKPEPESDIGTNNFLEVSARGSTRRAALAELGLVNMKSGGLNKCGTLLSGFTLNILPPPNEANGKAISRLRLIFRNYLKIKGDPFDPKDSRWKPKFKISDKRGAADERAKREGERNTVSFEQTTNNYPFELEKDEADLWIAENDK